MTDVKFKPIYFNLAAGLILGFPRKLDEGAFQERIRRILQTGESKGHEPHPVAFLSGKRRYICRPFFVEHRGENGKARPATLAILLERCPGGPLAVWKAAQRYHLSPRESESVRHLVCGLTTKEVAQQMKVSPNTIKQYIRLVMVKMKVTTRSGIVGRIVSL